MILLGILVTFLGFLLSAASVGIASSTGARMVLVLIGIAISLFGIIGLLNRGFMKNAVWKR
jgi:hypothetical protein